MYLDSKRPQRTDHSEPKQQEFTNTYNAAAVLRDHKIQKCSFAHAVVHDEKTIRRFVRMRSSSTSRYLPVDTFCRCAGVFAPRRHPLRARPETEGIVATATPHFPVRGAPGTGRCRHPQKLVRLVLELPASSEQQQQQQIMQRMRSHIGC